MDVEEDGLRNSILLSLNVVRSANVKMQLAGRNEHFLRRMAGQRSVIPAEMPFFFISVVGNIWRLATLTVAKCGRFAL